MTIQKIIAATLLFLSFASAVSFAYNDITSDKESSSILRECGINPSTGEYYAR